MSSPSDWIQLYQSNLIHTHLIGVPPPPTSSTTTSTSTATTSRNNNLALDQGRVAKPAVKRRSRASQRVPITVIKTDPTNFKTMVQKYTSDPLVRSQLSGSNKTSELTSCDAGTGIMTLSQVEHPPTHMQQQDMFTVHSHVLNSNGGGGGTHITFYARLSSMNGNQNLEY